jgi:hypothetical protein
VPRARKSLLGNPAYAGFLALPWGKPFTKRAFFFHLLSFNGR